MGMKRCESGHYYDTGKHVVCPLCCAVELGGGAKVVPQAQLQQQAPVPPRPPIAAEGKTVAVMKKETGIDPVVGWLVCTKGPNRGSDFRIKAEKNFIGRNTTMDICIGRDDTVSRENHAIISYNPKKKSFKVLPGDGRGLVYLNGDEVDAPKELSRGDSIELGQTALMLVPLCGPDFDWAFEESDA